MTDKALYLSEQTQNPPVKRRRRIRIGRVLLMMTVTGLLFFALITFVYRLIDEQNTVVPLPPQVSIDTAHVSRDRPDIPDSLLELLEKNPETSEFVMGYSADREPISEIDISGDITIGEIPMFLQWDERWGYDEYGSGMIAVTGCGPTCLSMVAVGLTGDTSLNPRTVADFSMENGYYAWGSGTAWTLMTDGAEQLGLYSTELSLQEVTIRNELESETPIICSVGSGDFTTDGHYIVLTGINSDDMVSVNDPNSIIRSETKWELSAIMKQVKNLWAFSAEPKSDKLSPPKRELRR